MSAIPMPYASLVEDSVVTLLQDMRTGFMAVAQQLADAREFTLPDFDLTDGQMQFYRARMSMQEYIASENPMWPAMFVYFTVVEDKRMIKFEDFSGTLQLSIDLYLSTDDPAVPEGLQQQANIFSDTIYNVFGILNSQQFQAEGILYNGGIRVVRQQPVHIGEAWMQAMNVVIPLAIP
jgi:hypothetical protein